MHKEELRKMLKERLRIVLLPVDTFDRRNDAEAIEDCVFTTVFKMLESLKKNSMWVKIFTLSDFMDACNDEEICLEGYWVTYIYLQK